MNTHIAPRQGTTLARAGRLWTTVRDEARAHRVAREQHRQLRSELAAYDTPSAIDDLLAAVTASGENHPEIEAILAENRAAYLRRERGIGRVA